MSRAKLVSALRRKRAPTLIESLDDFGPKGTRVEKNPYKHLIKKGAAKTNPSKAIQLFFESSGQRA